MKKLLTFTLTAALSLSLFAADIFTYAPINGNVKSYTETQYSIASKFGNYFRTPSSKITHEFDGNGKEKSSTEFSPRDAVMNKIASKYDSNGKLAEQICTNADNEIVWKMTTSYKDGLKVDVSEYDAKGLLKDRTIFMYEDGKLVDETSYDGEGALVWKTIYKYNAAGKTEFVYEYNNDGSLNEQKTYTYTDAGLVDSITTYDAFSGKQSQEIFRYGTNNVLNEITTYNNAKLVTKRVLIKYDSNGNVIKVSDYDVAEKFGTTVNELVAMSEYVYEY